MDFDFAGFGFWFWEVLFRVSVEFECVCVFGVWEVLSRKREKVSCIYSQPGSRTPCLYQPSDRAGLLPSRWIWNWWLLIRWHSTCSESKVGLIIFANYGIDKLVKRNSKHIYTQLQLQIFHILKRIYHLVKFQQVYKNCLVCFEHVQKILKKLWFSIFH